MSWHNNYDQAKKKDFDPLLKIEVDGSQLHAKVKQTES